MFASIRSALTAIIFILFSYTYSFAAKIAVIVPLEHEAMNQIVLGIKESLKDSDSEIIVKNAHGDANIMAALIKQARDDDEVKIIMPIGTSTSQMTLSHVKNKAIICVAAKIDNLTNPMATGLNDEVPITASLHKFHALGKIAVFYSANEKIAPEVEELKNYAKEHKIELHLSMIQTLTDLPAAVKATPDDVDGFLILKDHLVVSGINILTQESLKRDIPLIASDEGSVINGATIAIGVPEKEIGIQSGLIAKDVLNGVKPGEIAYKAIDSLVLFVNKAAFEKQKILTKKMLKDTNLPLVEILEQGGVK
jgi:putative ABC transport system substrate-binding protein